MDYKEPSVLVLSTQSLLFDHTPVFSFRFLQMQCMRSVEMTSFAGVLAPSFKVFAVVFEHSFQLMLGLIIAVLFCGVCTVTSFNYVWSAPHLSSIERGTHEASFLITVATTCCVGCC